MMYADLRTGPHGRIHHKTEVRSERKARVDGQEEQERCRISVPLVSTSDRQNWASHERRAVDEAVGETENENDGNAEQIGGDYGVGGTGKNTEGQQGVGEDAGEGVVPDQNVDIGKQDAGPGSRCCALGGGSGGAGRIPPGHRTATIAFRRDLLHRLPPGEQDPCDAQSVNAQDGPTCAIGSVEGGDENYGEPFAEMEKAASLAEGGDGRYGPREKRQGDEEV